MDLYDIYSNVGFICGMILIILGTVGSVVLFGFGMFRMIKNDLE
ncbi:hypothetical protein PDR89_27505 [Bacillus cereus group sp. Bc002]|nr:MULTISPECIES: hypothetical protein [Bacillus]MDA2688849.1 hypothetical protein [Bacillus cereus group sp. Bc030]MDA2783152.1 hypothetical protein [Bacillus cereus group sp. Bc002]MDO3376430.1 hypothetical protein [Bacillus paranthracis]MED1652184.1 hypothetical protein [Bacillus pacificus]